MDEGPSSRAYMSPPTPGASKKQVLSDRYLIGEELGRGAYGQVYKGIDLHTGDVVAIKQISLAGMSAAHQQSVMGEIELLKTLNHENIVKYIGSFKTRHHLYIILEYMENGALASIIKPNRFGVLSESLVSVYIRQVLQGLQYLHEQGVVHRDIKGANILTTKDGVVKLADFGVAAKLGDIDQHDELQANAVGTPYWMAPEVIEMTEVTSASDIWSVACLIIELITGYPPYHEMQPMSALFRIVNDDHPPVPYNVSRECEDFLMYCFQKDPKQRPGAGVLLQHEWIQLNRRTLKATWQSRNNALRATEDQRQKDAHESVQSVVARFLEYEESQDLDDSLQPSASGRHSSTPAPPPTTSMPPTASTPPALPGAVAATAASALLPLPAPIHTNALTTDSALDMLLDDETSTPPAGQHGHPSSAVTTSGAAAAVVVTGAAAVAGTSGVVAVTSITAGAAPLNGVLETSPLYAGPAQEGLPPLQSLNSVGYAEVSAGSMLAGGHASSSNGSHPHRISHAPSRSWRSPYTWSFIDADSPLAPLLAKLQAECGVSVTPRANSLSASTPLDRLDRTKLLNNPMYAATDVTTPVNITSSVADAINPHLAEMRKKVQVCVACLRLNKEHKMTQPEACQTLRGLLDRNPDARQMFVNEGGVLSLMELLDSDTKQLEPAVDLVLAYVGGEVRLLESVCLVGMVPSVLRCAAPNMPMSCRTKAATFMLQLLQHDTTAHMFVACQGLRWLVGCVESSVSDLSAAAVAGLWRVLEWDGHLPLSYVFRVLVQYGLVHRLFNLLKVLVSGGKKAGPLPPPGHRNGLSVDALPTDRLGSLSLGGGALTPSHAGGIGESTSVPLNASAHHVRSDSLPAEVTESAGVGSRRYTDTAHAGMVGACGNMARINSPPPNTLYATCEGTLAGVDPLERPAWLLERVVNLLLVLAHGDAVVRTSMVAGDNLKALLEVLPLVPNPHTKKMLHYVRRLTQQSASAASSAATASTSPASVESVLRVLREEGALPVLAAFLDRDKEPVGSEVQLEALAALHTICTFNPKVSYEAAAEAGIVPHLVRLAYSMSACFVNPNTAPRPVDPVTAAQWQAYRSELVPMLVGLVTYSTSARNKLYAEKGCDLFLHLLGEEDPEMQLQLLAILEVWLKLDPGRLEPRLLDQPAVQRIMWLAARAVPGQAQGANWDRQLVLQLLEHLREMMALSSKLSVAWAQAGLVVQLRAQLDAAQDPGASLLRVKLLQAIRQLYEFHPRPKEFILKYGLQQLVAPLCDVHGRGSDVVVQEAARLRQAFQLHSTF